MSRTQLLRRTTLSAALLSAILGLPGCGGSEGGTDEFTQEFEKPDVAPAPAVVDPPDTGDALSPRERRNQ